MNPTESWKPMALAKALATCPRTQWRPSPVYDFDGQRLALATMREQLSWEAARGLEKAMSAPGQWARTGRWPRLRNAGAFFLREALQWALGQYRSEAGPNTRAAAAPAPPWREDRAAWLQVATVQAWRDQRMLAWADEAAAEFYQSQQWHWELMHPEE